MERVQMTIGREIYDELSQAAVISGRSVIELLDEALEQFEYEPDEADLLFGPGDGTNIPSAEAEFIFALPASLTTEEKLEMLKQFRQRSGRA